MRLKHPPRPHRVRLLHYWPCFFCPLGLWSFQHTPSSNASSLMLFLNGYPTCLDHVLPWLSPLGTNSGENAAYTVSSPHFLPDPPASVQIMSLHPPVKPTDLSSLSFEPPSPAMGGLVGSLKIPIIPYGSKWKSAVDKPREPFFVKFDTHTEDGVLYRELVSHSAGCLNAMIQNGENPVFFPAQGGKIQFRIVVRNIEHPVEDSPDAYFLLRYSGPDTRPWTFVRRSILAVSQSPGWQGVSRPFIASSFRWARRLYPPMPLLKTPLARSL